jgi:hypothetical protein
MAEVALAAHRSKMTLSEANQWVLKLLPLYEHVFTQEGGNPGLPFDQVYDLSSVQPRDFWFKMYEEVISELKAMGLPL